jgi:hypothetical protein
VFSYKQALGADRGKGVGMVSGSFVAYDSWTPKVGITLVHVSRRCTVSTASSWHDGLCIAHSRRHGLGIARSWPRQWLGS